MATIHYNITLQHHHAIVLFDPPKIPTSKTLLVLRHYSYVDSIMQQGKLCIIMAYAAGGDLDSYLQRKRHKR